ncbi:glycosyl transferase [Komagataeibacter xylinus]|nr:glycosyl transferase family 2 [Komagataeibacter xylinus E25]RFP04427.1 glycosyl transferase [Komagataeibacter xylinus]RFP07497.1 glycosyl transferase [Komagataeibacter xylinus]
MPQREAAGAAGPGADVAGAMSHARHLAGQGQHGLALAWMERAARLAPADRGVQYALASARLGAGDGTGAASAVETVMAAGEFRAGLRLLVLAHCVARAWPRAARVLERFFTRYGFDPGLCIPAGLVCRHMALRGWCALDPDGVLHWGGLPEGRAPDVILDGQAWAPRKHDGQRAKLARYWRQARDIVVQYDGTPLLGARPDRAALLHVAGAVMPDGRGLAGWAFMPARPDRPPALSISDDVHGRRSPVLSRQWGTGWDDIAGPGTPVWGFGMAWADLAPQGMVHVALPGGRQLTGAPLPVCLPRARRVFPTMRRRVRIPDRIPRRAARCRVVIPVYADRVRTLACLNSVFDTLARRSDGAAADIMVVDDATPEPALALALDDLAGAGRISLRRHAANMGYPAAVNTALSDADGMDVVLLNSDTLLAPGWLDEMLRVAYARVDTGTVTPLSNDASILTWPEPEVPWPCDMETVHRLMAASLHANGGQDVEIPTAHGFCMLVRHDCLRQTGLFRPEFYGRGYGEENDFSMRARLAGWRHRAAAGVFVGHVGGVSFGAQRRALQQRNLWMLNRLFPGYDALVQAHIAADPLGPARQRLSLLVWHRAVRQSGHEGAVLLVTHDGTGGVARVVAHRARQWGQAGCRPLVLEPAPDGFTLRDGGPGDPCPALHFAWPGQGAALVALLRALGLRLVEVHHHLGHGARVRELCARLDVPYDRHVHDYAGICPRITLVGPAGRYCGEPDEAGCRACVDALGSLVEEVDVGHLRRITARELAGARRVVVPSADVARRLARYIPDVPCDISVLEDDRPALSLRQFAAACVDRPATGLPPRNDRCRVVVAGGIGPDKGHGIMLAAARDARARDLPLEFIVVGHTSDDAALLETGRVFITGQYEGEEAVALLRGAAGDVGFVPSVCPETWCFTLTQLWQAGLRCVAFDLGAVAARIRATGRGTCLPLGLPVHQLNTFLLSYARAGHPATDRVHP